MENIKTIAKDSAIYRMEQTSFFQLSPCEKNEIDLSKSLDTTVSPETLPVVAVLDDGIDFLDAFQTLVPVSWNAGGCNGIVGHHGTPVAGKIVFGHIGNQFAKPSLTPRARVIDCNIYGSDPRLALDTMTERIAEAVNAFAEECQIFNLSSNSEIPIEGDELSILGYQLDCLMKKQNNSARRILTFFVTKWATLCRSRNILHCACCRRRFGRTPSHSTKQ